mgnify:FL=1
MERDKNVRRCEAPTHSPGCNGIATTVDHFTPECIGKLWGWTKEEINAAENLQYLSHQCHKAKDSTTQARLALAALQQKGEMVFFGQHQELERIKVRSEIIKKYSRLIRNGDINPPKHEMNVFKFLLALRLQDPRLA